MGLFKEFKEFAVKGSAMDLAVGVVIGAAFGKVVTSLTNDIIMPPLGLLLGRVDFNKLQVVIQHHQDAVTEKVGDATKIVTPEVQEVAMRFGLFVNTLIDFVIVAFTIFIVIKIMNVARDKALLPWHQQAPAAAAAPDTAATPMAEPPHTTEKK